MNRVDADLPRGDTRGERKRQRCGEYGDDSSLDQDARIGKIRKTTRAQVSAIAAQVADRPDRRPALASRTPRQTLPRPMAITRSEEPASSETDGKRSFVFLSRFLLSARHAPSPETGRARDRGNPPM